ncbi:hypothetical protein GALMADRAFT_132783 [Galerina marginata CBS 339.88]|uniref:Uncharacterized protein n=1 Tax=Galerina marginata (strain CBS 339.88) TaxID=685588 RepID=A0A067TTS7_GALM3|nr:hypothetical protein GALMADRAFT_132783 [Galerina marginata CBS 339.88]
MAATMCETLNGSESSRPDSNSQSHALPKVDQQTLMLILPLTTTTTTTCLLSLPRSLKTPTARVACPSPRACGPALSGHSFVTCDSHYIRGFDSTTPIRDPTLVPAPTRSRSPLRQLRSLLELPPMHQALRHTHTPPLSEMQATGVEYSSPGISPVACTSPLSPPISTPTLIWEDGNECQQGEGDAREGCCGATKWAAITCAWWMREWVYGGSSCKAEQQHNAAASPTRRVEAMEGETTALPRHPHPLAALPLVANAISCRSRLVPPAPLFALFASQSRPSVGRPALPQSTTLTICHAHDFQRRSQRPVRKGTQKPSLSHSSAAQLGTPSGHPPLTPDPSLWPCQRFACSPRMWAAVRSRCRWRRGGALGDGGKGWGATGKVNGRAATTATVLPTSI